MCSNEIVHSGRQQRGPTWGKRLHCDSHLTRRPARCAGVTALFNFTKLNGQPKSVRGCLCKDGEVSKRSPARDVEGKGNGAVLWQNAILKKYHTRYSSPQRGGHPFRSLQPLPHSFRVYTAPHLQIPSGCWKRPTFSAERGGWGQRHTGTTASLWLPELMCPPVLHEWQFEWPASARKENPGSPSRKGKHPQGGEEQAGMARVWHHPSVRFHVSVQSPVSEEGTTDFLPPTPSSLTLPHIHYYDFQLLLHHHHYHTLRRCSSSDVWKQKRWGVKEREGASVMHCWANLKTRKQRPPIKRCWRRWSPRRERLSTTHPAGQDNPDMSRCRNSDHFSGIKHGAPCVLNTRMYPY